MILDGPAKTAARVIGVDRDRRATLAHVADQLAGAAGAFLDRRGAGLGDVVKIEAVAIGAADADRKGAGRLGGADGGYQQARCGNRGRGITPKARHGSPSPEEPWNASGEEFPDGEQG